MHTNVTKLPDTTVGNAFLNVRYLGWKANCDVTKPGGPFGNANDGAVTLKGIMMVGVTMLMMTFN